MKKRIFASLLAICMLGTSVFATTTGETWTEDFEIEPVDGFYVSMPEIRAYSEDSKLITSGTFETGAKETGAFYSNGGYVVTQEDVHSGSYGLKFTKMTNMRALAEPSNITAGVYELEAYVKSASPYKVTLNVNATVMGNFMKAVDATDPTIGGGDATNGQMQGVFEATPEWQRVVARYVFVKDTIGMRAGNSATSSLFADGSASTQAEFQITVAQGQATGTTAPLYIDDIKLRKVENAVPSTVARQSGMPTYPLSALAGKSNAQVVMDAKNESAAAKDLTLITAHFNADGSLNEVLNVYKTSVPVSTAVQHIESNKFSVPAGLTTGEIKTFVWDNKQKIFPYTEATGSDFTTNLQFKTGSENFKYDTPLPGTKNVFGSDSLSSASAGTTANYINSVSSVNPKSGVRSLYIASMGDTNSNIRTFTGVNFPVEPGREYELEFYAFMTMSGAARFSLHGATELGDLRGRAAMPDQVWTSTDFTGLNTTPTDNIKYTAPADNNGVWKTVVKSTESKTLAPADSYHLRAITPTGKWMKVTCRFETPAADALAKDYIGHYSYAFDDDSNYWAQYGKYMSLSFAIEGNACKDNGSVGNGAWIDDIKLTDMGAADGVIQ